MSRLFTDEQLRDIAEPPSEKALRALASGEIQTLNGLLCEMAAGPAGVEGLSLHVLARFAGELRQDFGEERAIDLLDRIGRNIMRSFIADYENGKEREVIVDLVSIFKHQGGGNLVPVAETDDEVVYDLAPCGSGGRFILDGTVDKSPNWYGRWSNAISSYCQTCKACQRALNEATGVDVWTTEISASVPGRCTLRFKKNLSHGTRLFPGRELYGIAKTKIQSAIERSAKHDYKIADLLKDQQRDWLPWHDFLISMAGYMFGTCYVERGSQYLADKLKSAYNSTFSLFYPVFVKLGDEQNLRYLCKSHHYHMMHFTLTEESDRFAFRLDPCGSGGRHYRGEIWRGLFQYGGELSVLIEKPHPVSFQRENFPVYCTHCAAHNQDQFSNDVLYFVNDGHAQMRPGMACLQFTYKKGVHVGSIPQALLGQVGM